MSRTTPGPRHEHDDDQIIALVSLIAMINATNRIGVILDNRGGSYVPAAPAGAPG